MEIDFLFLFYLIHICERGPKNQNLFIKNFIFILTYLNFSHLQTTLHLIQCTYQYFFPPLKIVFELVDFDAFSASAVFLFHLILQGKAKCFPWRISFHVGKQKKSCSGWRGWVGQGVHVVFGQKLLNIQHSMGRFTCKSPIMKWANALKESSKKL